LCWYSVVEEDCYTDHTDQEIYTQTGRLSLSGEGWLKRRTAISIIYTERPQTGGFSITGYLYQVRQDGDIPLRQEASSVWSSIRNAVKEQFLLNRLVAASQAENTRNLGLQILSNRMENMSDKTLLKTISKLDKGGALDLATITEKPIPGRPSPVVSLQQVFGL